MPPKDTDFRADLPEHEESSLLNALPKQRRVKGKITDVMLKWKANEIGAEEALKQVYEIVLGE